MKFKLKLPINGTITQYFGQNANSLYAQDGLYGHPAVDIVSHYDDIITDPIIGFNKKYIYSLLNKDSPDPMRYRAVCMIVEADDGVFEVVLGHCNKITCEVGPVVNDLATEGNTGDVFVGSHAVTAKEKAAGSTAGFHTHFQVRRLKKVKYSTLHSLITVTGKDFIDEDGYHFDAPHYNNGYNGCINPLQFVTPNNYQFTRDLQIGSWGVDVYQLQKRLVGLGFATFTPIGTYGPQTAQAVREYQEACGIDMVGRVGPLTRISLNS